MDVFTVKQASSELGIPARTILYRLKIGEMQGELIDGQLWLIPRAEVEAWRQRGELRRGRKPRQHD
jgi:excisionase family DNA binding protein